MLDFQVSTIVFTVINLLVLYFILRKLLFGRVNAVLEQRAARVKETIDSAEASKSQAEELRAEYEDKLTDARQEAAKLVADAQNRAQRAYEAKMADAETDAKRLRSEAEAQIASERDAMLRGARNEVASLALRPPPRWPSGPRRTATGRWWTPSWRKWVSRHERARRRYAQALWQVSPDGEALERTARALMEEPALWEALCSPAVQAGEKGRVLARLPGLEEGGPLPHFYRLLAEKAAWPCCLRLWRRFTGWSWPGGAAPVRADLCAPAGGGGAGEAPGGPVPSPPQEGDRL